LFLDFKAGDYEFVGQIAPASALPPGVANYSEWRAGWLKHRTDKFFGVLERRRKKDYCRFERPIASTQIPFPSVHFGLFWFLFWYDGVLTHPFCSLILGRLGSRVERDIQSNGH